MSTIKTAHTPGPWSQRRLRQTDARGNTTGPDVFRVTTDKVAGFVPHHIANVMTDPTLGYQGFGEGEANARLIAAAPDMKGLALLCNCYLEPIADQLEICHSQPHEAKALRQLLEMARSIIAKL
jgi:hypothetical protein